VTPWTAARSDPGGRQTARPSSTRAFLAATLLLIALPCLGYAIFASTLLLPFPFSLNIAIAGSLAAALAIAAVAAVAPRSQRLRFVMWTAILSIATEVAVVYILHREAPAAIVSAAVGTAAAAVWLAPASTLLLRRSGIVLSALYVTLLTACFVDWPSIPDAVPYELAAIIDSKSVGRFYSYRLTAFIDSEWLWRIDAPPDVLDSIATKSGMSPCANAPNAFWRMPPYYWPRAIPNGGRIYCTPSFPADRRGPDGWHFIMAVDVNRSRAFVWFKNNF
jgi:hypothetical protein